MKTAQRPFPICVRVSHEELALLTATARQLGIARNALVRAGAVRLANEALEDPELLAVGQP